MPKLPDAITTILTPLAQERLRSLRTEEDTLVRFLAGKPLNGNGHAGAAYHLMKGAEGKKRKRSAKKVHHRKARANKANAAYVNQVWAARKALGMTGKMKKSQSKKVRAYIAKQNKPAAASASA